MGTRNMTMVIHKEEMRVAQYGQWDGYPNGQGRTVCSFIEGHLIDPKGLEKFRSQTEKCRQITKEEWHELKKQDTTGYEPISMKKPEYYVVDHEKGYKVYHGMLSRDTAAECLAFIYNCKDEYILVLLNQEFCKNGLFCEYAYLLDLDNEALELYRGFCKEDPQEENRFGSEQQDTGYYPVQLVGKIPFKKMSHEKIVHLYEEYEKERA